MLDRIKHKLMKGDYLLHTVENVVYNVYGCSELLNVVTEKANDQQLKDINTCFIGNCNNLNDVIHCWYADGCLPDNSFKAIYKAYVDNDYAKAMYLILSNFANVEEYRVLCTKSFALHETTVEEYVKFIPKQVLRKLVERCIYDPRFGSSELFCKHRTVGEWFSYCSKQGWLSFEPYVYEETSNPMLVIKYNRVIFFDGESWGIYSSTKKNGFWYKGACIQKSIWHMDSPYFVSALFWAAFVCVGCRMTEVADLIDTRYDLMYYFIQAAARTWSVKMSTVDFASVFSDCLRVSDMQFSMCYRLVKDANSEYARLNIIDRWSGKIEVPNGICPQTIEYDFNKLFGTDIDVTERIRKLGPKNISETLLCGVLALASVMLDDKSVYAMNKEATLRAGRAGELVEIRTVEDLPHYI